MDLQQLTYFVAVAEERSFTRAAAREHVVQSTVSSAISRLEQELGAALFVRAPGGTDTTSAGDLLLTRARRILADAQEVREELRALHGSIEGTVTIGGPLSTGSLDMPAVFRELQRTAPQVDLRVRIFETAHELPLAPLLEGRCDLLLLQRPAATPQGVDLSAVGTLELALVTTDPIPQRPWTIEEAASAARIDFPADWPTRRRTDEYFAGHGADRKVQIEVADVAAALTLIRAGLGAAFLPASLVHEWADVRAVELAHPIPAHTLVLAARTIPQRPAVKALQRHILDHASRSTPWRPGRTSNRGKRT